jgi:Flp pilus assembly protein CpaB
VKRSNRLVILVGVLLAVLAFVGIVILLNSRPGGTTQQAPVKVNVIIAKEDIEIGEEVTPDKVELLQVDPAAVVGTPFGDPSQVSGQRAIFAIPAQSQVPKEALGLGLGGEVCIECQLLPGEKAIAFQVDRVTGLDFLVQTGDHLDIVLSQGVAPLQETQASIDARAADPDLQPRYEAVVGVSNVRTVKTILTDKRVLYVSATRIRPTAVQATPSPGQQGAQQAPAPQIENVIIVIAGSDQDAELIKFAQNDLNELGQLTAILRRVADAEEGVPEEVTTGITLDILIDQYDVPIPDIVVLPLPTPPAP